MLVELRRILRERREAGGFTALIIDEAQAMSHALLEEVRLLTNMETSTEQLLPIVLVGQAELAERLNEPKLHQLKQRVALRSKLAPLTAQETTAYIAERIRIAGGDVASIFTPRRDRGDLRMLQRDPADDQRHLRQRAGLGLRDRSTPGRPGGHRGSVRAISISRRPRRQDAGAGDGMLPYARTAQTPSKRWKLPPVAHRLLAPAVPLGAHALPEEGAGAEQYRRGRAAGSVVVICKDGEPMSRLTKRRYGVPRAAVVDEIPPRSTAAREPSLELETLASEAPSAADRSAPADDPNGPATGEPDFEPQDEASGHRFGHSHADKLVVSAATAGIGPREQYRTLAATLHHAQARERHKSDGDERRARRRARR